MIFRSFGLPIITILLIASSEVLGNERRGRSLEFLQQEVTKNQKRYRYNRYERIISGGAAFLIGNIGYFTTESVTLELAYSGIQTIGILNIGDGIYDYYRPTFDRELYKVARNSKNPNSTAYGVIKTLAQEEKAKRISLLWKSSLLSVQYLSNAYLKSDEESLKDIYKFLGGVNIIVAGYSYFYRDKYESFIFGENAQIQPILFRSNQTENDIPGLVLSYRF